MEKKIIEIIEEILDIEKGTISLDTEITDVENWDSMMQLMILSELQEKLNIDISIQDAIEIKNVADFIKFANK